MTTSPSPQAPSNSPSNGVSGASLPQWRLWLQTLNWRRDPGYEQRKIQHELRMKQLESEIEQSKERTKQLESETELIKNETEQLRRENARLASIESRLARFEREHLSGSNLLSSTGDSSPS